MEKIIDQAWESLLASVLKKRTVARPGIGDEIDMYVPQSRLLSLAQADPAVMRSLYTSARESARRNAVNIVTQLGMPADYFWKFEYWPKARAYTALEKIVSRVFSSIMRKAKEGELKITALDIDPLVIDIDFADCVECAGMDGLERKICFYHAGTLAGILSGLINRDLDCFESDCHVSGSESCHFKVFDSSAQSLLSAFEAYISPEDINPDFIRRLERSLKKETLRNLGNMVDINYHQLTLANYLHANPELLASDSYDIGAGLGRKIAPFIAGYYGDEGLKNLEEYYMQLGQFGIEIKTDGNNVTMVISECAECTDSSYLPGMTSFLTGELCGLLSSVMDIELELKQSAFEGDNLILTFVPKGQGNGFGR